MNEEFRKVKDGKALAKFVRKSGGELHDTHNGTKAVYPGKGSFLFNITKDFSKHDLAHYKRVLKALGILILLGMIFLYFLLNPCFPVSSMYNFCVF